MSCSGSGRVSEPESDLLFVELLLYWPYRGSSLCSFRLLFVMLNRHIPIFVIAFIALYILPQKTALAESLHLKCDDRELVLEDGFFRDEVLYSSQDTSYRLEKIKHTLNEHQIILHGYGYSSGYFADAECTEPKRCNFDMVFSRAGFEAQGLTFHEKKYVALDPCFTKSGYPKKCRQYEAGEILDTGQCQRLER